jgi:ABC-type sugar transport system ATPase subunit
MISPDAEVKTLSIAEQQLVEIAKALSFDSKVLIMDEPTAALATHEVEILTRLIHKLIATGIAVIFISHRFTEVFDLAKTITVLKDGQHVATVAASAPPRHPFPGDYDDGGAGTGPIFPRAGPNGRDWRGGAGSGERQQ